jgi:hypothetical protein
VKQYICNRCGHCTNYEAKKCPYCRTAKSVVVREKQLANSKNAYELLRVGRQAGAHPAQTLLLVAALGIGFAMGLNYLLYPNGPVEDTKVKVAQAPVAAVQTDKPAESNQ